MCGSVNGFFLSNPVRPSQPWCYEKCKLNIFFGVEEENVLVFEREGRGLISGFSKRSMREMSHYVATVSLAFAKFS